MVLLSVATLVADRSVVPWTRRATLKADHKLWRKDNVLGLRRKDDSIIEVLWCLALFYLSVVLVSV